MTSDEIRKKYINFFKKKGHAEILSASLFPENDSTLLFTNSGMFPLVPYLLGEKHPHGNRLTNSQKSFRAEDIEEIGDQRHTTFFEMLGNWSLGDYFKKEELNWWFEFLVEELKLNPSKFYQTVYTGDGSIEKDNESVEILKSIYRKYGVDVEEGAQAIDKGELGAGVEIDFDKHRIFAYRDKNWWQRGDAIGELGGPDSETFYDTGKKHNSEFGKFCHLNCDCGRFIEIGNAVFMQYQKTENGWQPLKNKNVDFGGGLERITMIMQNKNSIFRTDLYINIINKIEQLSGKKYEENMKPFEVIADHIKAATFIMGDDKGIAPSNLDQGYIIRRLIRRAIRFGKQLGISKNLWTKEIAKVVVDDYKKIYSELERNADFVFGEFEKEEEKFGRTLEKGLKMLDNIKKDIVELSHVLTKNNKLNETDKIFLNKNREWLYNGISVLLKEIANSSRIKSTNKKIVQPYLLDGLFVFKLYTTYGFPVELIKEELKNTLVKIDADQFWRYIDFTDYIDRKIFEEAFKKHQQLSRTASAGKFKGGLADASEQTTRLHTAAHLLLESLRRILGDHVYQKGSNITAERMRFDFSHPDKLTDKEKKKVEDIINEQIQKKLLVNCEEMTLGDAKKLGAMGMFESKYGQMVKVYTIGSSASSGQTFSKEICGGPHVKNTSELGKFRIKKEQSSGFGVRRIKAVLE